MDTNARKGIFEVWSNSNVGLRVGDAAGLPYFIVFNVSDDSQFITIEGDDVEPLMAALQTAVNMCAMDAAITLTRAKE